MSSYHEPSCNCDLCKLGAKVKELEVGINKLIIHYEILSRVSYADSFNSKIQFENFVQDLKALKGKDGK